MSIHRDYSKCNTIDNEKNKQYPFFFLKPFITLKGVNIFPNESFCRNKEYVTIILQPIRNEPAEIASVILMKNNSDDIDKKSPHV